jgi:DUF971 family protein
VTGAPTGQTGSPWPTSLDFHAGERLLRARFDDGCVFDIAYELLRVESPSAQVQGHGPGQKQAVAGKETVGIVRADPVGRYAVRLVFDDGHDTGLYTWDWLYRLGRDRDALLAAHRARVAGTA